MHKLFHDRHRLPKPFPFKRRHRAEHDDGEHTIPDKPDVLDGNIQPNFGMLQVDGAVHAYERVEIQHESVPYHQSVDHRL